MVLRTTVEPMIITSLRLVTAYAYGFLLPARTELSRVLGRLQHLNSPLCNTDGLESTDVGAIRSINRFEPVLVSSEVLSTLIHPEAGYQVRS